MSFEFKKNFGVSEVQDFKKLFIWQKSHTLALSVYKVTAAFPDVERYGLTSQIRRACVSVPSNIAEGCGRNGNVELNRFLHIALGSAAELEYQILLAYDLKLLDDIDYERLDNQISEVRKMLIAFIQKLGVDS